MVAARKLVRYTVLVLLRCCRKLEFKRVVYCFSLTSWNLLLGNRYYLSGLRIVVTVRSSQIVDSDTLGFWLHSHEIAILKRISIVLKKTDDCGL